uniref:Uncharacterized protein n=1 Tax=Denticeps clupeoides TaxID=299321 RepID=A0AAY4BNE3_9TELE
LLVHSKSSAMFSSVAAGCDMMPGQIPDRRLGAMLSPLHLLGKLGKRPVAIKAERDEEEEMRKRRRGEKQGCGRNIYKGASGKCHNVNVPGESNVCIISGPQESERLEMMNSELKQLIIMLNRHRPTCIVRTDSIKTPEGEANPLLEQLEAEAK